MSTDEIVLTLPIEEILLTVVLGHALPNSISPFARLPKEIISGSLKSILAQYQIDCLRATGRITPVTTAENTTAVSLVVPPVLMRPSRVRKTTPSR